MLLESAIIVHPRLFAPQFSVHRLYNLLMVTSPDEWEATKHACQDENLTFLSLTFSV